MKLILAIVALIATPSTSFAPSPHHNRHVPTATFSTKEAMGDEFVVGILGDLHIDPRKMEDYGVGRSHFLPIFEEGKSKHGNVALVSLGDLGESKSVRPEETSELFAGTTECHEMAAEFLGSFGVDYDVVGGNHDLEGLDEVSLKFCWGEVDLQRLLIFDAPRIYILFRLMQKLVISVVLLSAVQTCSLE